MAEEATAPNPLDIWRQFITDSERQWNGFFREVLGTDAMASGLNTYMETSLTVQRMVADQLERLYETFNVPTHGDLMELGGRLKAIEDLLARIESSRGTRKTRKPPARKRPPRTKQPAGSRNGSN